MTNIQMPPAIAHLARDPRGHPTFATIVQREDHGGDALDDWIAVRAVSVHARPPRAVVVRGELLVEAPPVTEGRPF